MAKKGQHGLTGLWSRQLPLSSINTIGWLVGGGYHSYTGPMHCPKDNTNFPDITQNVEENEILPEIFCEVSCFPSYISCYISENRLHLGQCTYIRTVYTRVCRAVREKVHPPVGSLLICIHHACMVVIFLRYGSLRGSWINRQEAVTDSLRDSQAAAAAVWPAVEELHIVMSTSRNKYKNLLRPP